MADSTCRYQAVVIGVSAGGMDALSRLLQPLAGDFPLPIIVVQHLHYDQDSYLAEYLDRLCRLRVKEAAEKEKIAAATVYLAPANYHLLLEGDRTFSLSIDEKVNFARPSIDVLFESAVDVYGSGLIGIILTGANSDGVKGMALLKAAGGLAIVQDPATADTPFMPQETINKVKVDHVLPLEGIAKLLAEILNPI